MFHSKLGIALAAQATPDGYTLIFPRPLDS